jgi:hypothetical protein
LASKLRLVLVAHVLPDDAYQRWAIRSAQDLQLKQLSRLIEAPVKAGKGERLLDRAL